jgi:putative ABC transport system permease protein
VLLISLRDLEWRRRRFAIVVVATAVVFALALLLSGVSASFDREIERTVSWFEADRWIVREATLGPFTGPAPFPAERVEEVRALPGVSRADPVVVLGATATAPAVRNVNLIGVVPGGVGPGARDAEALADETAALADASLGVRAGDTLEIGGVRLTVAEVLRGRTYFAGIPVVVVALPVAQRIGLDGGRLATAIVTEGVAAELPAGLSALRNEEVEADLGRPIAPAQQTIAMIRWLLWAVAAGIIAAVVYLSALERTSDFAVFKAIGVSTRDLALGLVVQAVILAALAAALSVGIELAMAPASAIPVEVSLLTYLTLPLVAVAVGVLASAIALRRAVKIDPALAFGG